MSMQDVETIPAALSAIDVQTVTLEQVAHAMQVEESDYADDLKRLRAFALSFNNAETTLTDGQLAYLISCQTDDQDAETWAELIGDMEKELAGEEEEADTEGTVTVGATGIREEEHALGLKLDKPEWKAFASQNIEAADFMAQSAVRAALLIQATFTPEELAAIPVFGTEAKDKSGKIVTNNPDVYLAPGKGKRKVIRHRVYDIVDDTLLAERWAYVKKLEDAEGNVAGADRDLLNLHSDGDFSELSTAISNEKKRIGAVRRSFKDGVRILQKMADVETHLPNVTVTFAKDEKGNLRAGAYCLRITSKINGNYGFQTYGSFLRMNIAKAKAKGGTMADLLATVGRGANQQSADGGVKTTEAPKNAESFLNVAQGMIQYLCHGEESELLKHVAAIKEKMKGDGGRMTKLIVGRLIVALDDAFWDEDFQKEYFDLNREEEKKAKRIEKTPLQEKADAAEKRSKLLSKAS